VVARVQEADRSRYVRLGPQFCVADADSALQTLTAAAFKTTLLSPLEEPGPQPSTPT
jgi:hypothetical protein